MADTRWKLVACPLCGASAGAPCRPERRNSITRCRMAHRVRIELAVREHPTRSARAQPDALAAYQARRKEESERALE